MRHNLLALLLASAFSPLAAFAGSTTPCDLVDAEALAALKLGEVKKTLEHKDVPATKESPQQGIDSCVMTPKNAPSPSLTVTTASLPAGDKAVELSCSEQALFGMRLNVCNVSANSTFMTFVLMTPSSADADTPRIFRSQIERLLKRSAESGAGASSK